MKAVVIKSFPGAIDGQIYPRQFTEGDVIEGELARVAIAAGLAKPQKPEQKSGRRPVASPVEDPA